jgi:hypothetical protein
MKWSAMIIAVLVGPEKNPALTGSGENGVTGCLDEMLFEV